MSASSSRPSSRLTRQRVGRARRQDGGGRDHRRRRRCVPCALRSRERRRADERARARSAPASAHAFSLSRGFFRLVRARSLWRRASRLPGRLRRAPAPGFPAGFRTSARARAFRAGALPQPYAAADARAECRHGRSAQLMESRARVCGMVSGYQGRITSYNTVNQPCYNSVITGCIFRNQTAGFHHIWRKCLHVGVVKFVITYMSTM